MLGAVARGRELRTSRSISQVLAWRIGHYLDQHPSPAVPAADRSDPESWQRLAWTLKAAENTGTPAATIISGARRARHLRDLLAQAQYATWQQPAGHESHELPWLRRPRPHVRDADDDGLVHYLDEAAALISTRTRSLADTAIGDRPAWMSLLGDLPASQDSRDWWLRHVGVIAAYRDQHQITTDDPHQVLGPYPEPGRAGHTAYWHAVEVVVAARQLAGLEPTTKPESDAVSVQIAADIYRALPDAERAELARDIAGRLGPLSHSPGTPGGDAITLPVVARRLIESLTERGHLIKTAPRRTAPRPVEADLAERDATRHPRRARRAAPGRPSSSELRRLPTPVEASTPVWYPADGAQLHHAPQRVR
jgi:hypothetical protein